LRYSATREPWRPAMSEFSGIWQGLMGGNSSFCLPCQRRQDARGTGRPNGSPLPRGSWRNWKPATMHNCWGRSVGKQHFRFTRNRLPIRRRLIPGRTTWPRTRNSGPRISRESWSGLCSWNPAIRAGSNRWSTSENLRGTDHGWVHATIGPPRARSLRSPK
jgi:hypothetical protein